MLEKIYAINQGMDQKFPQEKDPYQILARMLEECGELAEQVHIFEDSGIKRQKHGAPDPKHLAKEIQDVLRCALQIAQYYHVEDELAEEITYYYQRVIDEGLINPAG